MAQLDFVVKNGLVVLNGQRAESTSTNTGALIVNGGLGVGGNITLGKNLTVFGASTLQQDTYVGGNLAVQLNQTNTGTITVLNLTASTSSTSGALTVAGGVGIAGTLNSNVIATPVLTATNAVITTASIAYANFTTASIATATIVNLIVSTKETVQGTLTVAGLANFTDTTNSTSSDTGALTVAGGVGITQDLNVGGNITAQGNIIANGNIVLGNSTGTDVVTIGAEINSSIIPKISETYNLGTATNVWNTVWADSARLVGGVDASSTTTGDLVVKGGIGVGGTIYASGAVIDGQLVVTNANLVNYGVATIFVGTDTAISSSSGIVTIWNTSTLQSITSRGSTTPSAIKITNTTSSTSTTTGALNVTGGVGIQGDVYVGGNVYSAQGSPLANVKVTVSTSPPTTATNNIGDFWIDPSIGVEYQYVPNGTATVWIQFIGF